MSEFFPHLITIKDITTNKVYKNDHVKSDKRIKESQNSP